MEGAEEGGVARGVAVKGAPGRGLVVALLLVTAALFARNVASYSFLNDDAFISFRYSSFLAGGHGIAWNVGERVEGYTSFLWVLLMAAGLRLGLAPEILSNVLGIASGVGVLALLVRFSARRWGAWNPWISVPPLVLATSRNFTAWCTGGQETMLFVLLSFAAVDALFEERQRLGGRVLSPLWLALATLTRPEGMGLAGVLFAFVASDALRFRRGLGPVVRWAAPYAILVGAHLLWRHAYYGAWLPNTFHAKVAGLMVGRGLEYLSWFQRDCFFAWFLPWIFYATWRARDFDHALLLAWIVFHTVYVVLVGGDVFEFRFLVFVFPAAYWLLVDGIRRMAADLSVHARVARVPATALVLVALFAATARGLTRDILVERSSYLPSVRGLQAGVQHEIELGKALRELIDAGVLPRDLYLAIGSAGAVPYYTGWRILDWHGLNDFEIARMPVLNSVLGHQHLVDLDYMRRRGVEAVTVGPLLPKVPRFDSSLGSPALVRNVRVGQRYFSFLSLMPEETFRAKFGRLEEVPNPRAQGPGGGVP